jgi:hypothetical protein
VLGDAGQTSRKTAARESFLCLRIPCGRSCMYLMPDTHCACALIHPVVQVQETQRVFLNMLDRVCISRFTLN